MPEHSSIREALQGELSSAQDGADRILALLESCDLVLALDVATVREAQGGAEMSLPGIGPCCSIEDLEQWDAVLGALQARVQEARNSIARLKAENLRFKEQLVWQLP